ncbi:MAG: MobV family relaxase [Ethanoligenens sp.]
MPQYAILRFAKHKGGSARALEAHHERRKAQYKSNPDIDTSRSKYNFHLVRPKGSYKQEIDSRITAAGCRTRKDSTRLVDTLVTASPEFFKGMQRKEIWEFFRRAEFLIGHYVGMENIVSAVVHLDKKTPHIHLVFVPLTKEKHLSAKYVLGNRAQLSQWQDVFYNYMAKKYPNLSRGESSRETGREHIPTQVFKQAEDLSRQARCIRGILQNVNPNNAIENNAEAISLLNKWFPQMGKLDFLLKKYASAISTLEDENARLRPKEEPAEKPSLRKELEIAKLKSDVENLRRFVNSIPPELRAQIEQARRNRNPYQQR